MEKAATKKIDDENLSEIKRNHWRTVVINVGGVKYRSKISNFSKYPASRLGKIFRAGTTDEILEYCDGYKPGNPPMIFFDRNDQNFNSIIDCYRMGELHVCSQNCSLVTQAGLKIKIFILNSTKIYLSFRTSGCRLEKFPSVFSLLNCRLKENVKILETSHPGNIIIQGRTDNIFL